MIRGSCHCGAVRFEIDQVRALTHCHCTNCRKLTGAAFATYAHADADKFRFVAGEDMTVAYESAPGSFRYRCKACGCLTPGKASYLPTVSIPAGLLDDDPQVRPRLHVFTSSRAPWWTIQDDLPQHEKWVPGFEPKS
ncbi:GFA family protein [Bradyrhizobium symbiodeficiens]|uniref:GFA family protein n=1 Tax=Bradyrhizobium symbiodeficiens TaxID=1404367 RepID=UPI0030CC674B